MFVARRMKKKIVTAAPSASLFEAQRLMREHTIRQVPVVSEDGTLLGIVADRFCGGKVVSILEGGYETSSLTSCIELHVRELLGE